MNMESHKQSTILYALGFVEDYIDNNTQPLVVGEEGTEQDQKNNLENEYRSQVQAMWAVLDAGFKQLLAENGRLLNKISMAELALKS